MDRRDFIKTAAAVVSARRAGTTATLDQLNKYFGITEMPIISGRYWNMVHGNTPAEVKQDKEGLRHSRDDIRIIGSVKMQVLFDILHGFWYSKQA